MAIQSRKISSFPNLSNLTGDEVIMVAYKGKSYKVPLNVLTGNAIQAITQRLGTGDGADNPITMTVGVGNDTVQYTFSVFNGSKGSKGETGDQGPKGLKGDTSVALYNADVSDLIYDSLLAGDEVALSELILSAAQGVILNEKLEALKEVYLESQDDYDALLAKGEIYDNVKYFIFEN